jgi:hypothetical protein
MKIRYYLLSFIFLLLLGSCEKIDLGEELELRVGVNYEVTNNMSFTIDKVNDSRCPVGAYCIWAGDAYLYLDINYLESYKDTIALWNSYEETNPAEIGPYSIEVLDVIPYPEIGKHISQSDIRVKVIIDRL